MPVLKSTILLRKSGSSIKMTDFQRKFQLPKLKVLEGIAKMQCDVSKIVEGIVKSSPVQKFGRLNKSGINPE